MPTSAPAPTLSSAMMTTLSFSMPLRRAPRSALTAHSAPAAAWRLYELGFGLLAEATLTPSPTPTPDHATATLSFLIDAPLSPLAARLIYLGRG